MLCVNITLNLESDTVIDLTRLPAAEAERLAYAEGFTGTAALFARIAALEAENKTLEQELEILRDDLYTARHERAYGGAD